LRVRVRVTPRWGIFTQSVTLRAIAVTFQMKSIHC
jgi:hypothetical protein